MALVGCQRYILISLRFSARKQVSFPLLKFICYHKALILILASFLRSPTVPALALWLDPVKSRFSCRFLRFSCSQLLLWASDLLSLSILVFQPWSDHFICVQLLPISSSTFLSSAPLPACPTHLCVCPVGATEFPKKYFLFCFSVQILPLHYLVNKCGDKSDAVYQRPFLPAFCCLNTLIFISTLHNRFNVAAELFCR
jgi:hypothetical protein